MKMFQRLLGIFLITAASAGLLVACGDDDSCITTSDCASDEVCNLETETCMFACQDDGDCLDDEVCDTDNADSADEGVCVLAGTGNNGNNGDNNGNNGDTCSVDTDCEDSDQVCEAGVCVDDVECTTSDECPNEDDICVEGVCEPPSEGPTYMFARIADASENIPALCEPNSNDPGADIAGVELDKGDTSYWAQFVNYDNIDTEDNEFVDVPSVITGEPTGLSLQDQCPEAFNDDNIVALGCEGSMLVQFVDESDTPQPIEDGDTINVYEWGSQCQSDPSDDQDDWSVSICEAGSDALLNAECAGEFGVGSGSGFTGVTVDFPEDGA